MSIGRIIWNLGGTIACVMTAVAVGSSHLDLFYKFIAIVALLGWIINIWFKDNEL